MRTEGLAQAALIILGAVALFSALHAVSDIFAPLALALTVGVVLSPVSDACERWRVPRGLAAVLTLLGALLLIGILSLTFQPTAESLVAKAPKVWADLRELVASVRSLLKGIVSVTDGLSKAIAPGPDLPASALAATGAAAAPPPAQNAPAMPVPSVTDTLLVAEGVLSEVMVFAGSLFFFLLTRTEIYDWAARRLAAPAERGQTVRRMRAAERRVSRYFLTITAINAGLGVASAVAFQAIGLPSAITWGLGVFLLNFVPYLGPGIGVVGMIYAGIAAFDGSRALAPVAAYLTLITIESQFITPTLIGRNAALNPLLVFLALIFGFWLWGPVGGVVAIPLLLWVLVLADALPEAPAAPAAATPPAEAQEDSA